MRCSKVDPIVTKKGKERKDQNAQKATMGHHNNREFPEESWGIDER